MPIKMKSVCVFCGSSLGTRPAYVTAAQATGKTLAANNLEMVFGGGRVGLMGQVANSALAAGAKVIGVIPEFIANKEIAHGELSQLHVVNSMHERKALMAKLSDGFMALPGGFGTLEEFCEILTWAQLGLHQKPLGLLNINGYYDSLLQFFDHALAEAFLSPEIRSLVTTGNDPQALLNAMMEKEPLLYDKWLETDAET